MTSVISDKKKVIFIHIPKTGGSSVEKVLLKQPSFYLLKDTLLEDYYMWESMVKHSPILNKKLKSYYVFTIVRHPETRFLSAYNDFFHTRQKKVYLESKLTLFNALKKPEKCKPTYKGFYAHAYPLMVEHLPNLKYINSVIRFENLETEVRNVLDDLNISCPKRFPHVRKSKKHVTHLTKTEKEMIYEIFKYDYEVFDYD